MQRHRALEGLANKVLAAEYRTTLPEERLLVEEIKSRGRGFLPLSAASPVAAAENVANVEQMSALQRLPIRNNRKLLNVISTGTLIDTRSPFDCECC